MELYEDLPVSHAPSTGTLAAAENVDDDVRK
jgi:hypothetical protein